MPDPKKAGQEPGAKKPKFDPDTLAPEMRAVYDGMLAEYTKKTQAHGKEKEAWTKQLSDLQTQMQTLQKQVGYYERMIPQVYDQDQDAGGGPVAGFDRSRYAPDGGGRGEPNGEVQWNPFDRGAQDSLIRYHLNNYHKMLEQTYNQLVKGIMELQAYNLQLNRVAMAPLYTKLGMEMPDFQKIIQAAPQYGHDLQQAYRAIYESPQVWERANQHEALTKERDALKARVDKFERDMKTPNAGVLGGTTGPVPRTVAQGKQPKSYAEVAASISPAEVFGPDGGAGAGAGTTGAGDGGSAE